LGVQPHLTHTILPPDPLYIQTLLYFPLFSALGILPLKLLSSTHVSRMNDLIYPIRRGRCWTCCFMCNLCISTLSKHVLGYSSPAMHHPAERNTTNTPRVQLSIWALMFGRGNHQFNPIPWCRNFRSASYVQMALHSRTGRHRLVRASG